MRNDKDTNIDLILNILIIKEIIKKNNFKKITVITDNKITIDLLKKINPNIKFIYNGYSFLKPELILFKILKFYFKAFFVVIFAKVFCSKNYLAKPLEEACLSIYPMFYKKNESFFHSNKKIKLNFLLTDETHLNCSFTEIIKNIIQVRNKKLINLETFITPTSFLKAFCKSIFFYFLTMNINFKLNINNLELSKFYKDCIFKSLINRSKLNIYEYPIISALQKFKIKTFNLYLFEYSFGFFIINLIRKNINKVKIVGYQHGIFSDQLLWLDVILKNKNRYNYLPQEIKAFNSKSFYDYKNKINSKKINFSLVKKTPSILAKQYFSSKDKAFSNNILVLPGTHDVNSIYNILKAKTIDKKNKTVFFLKFHPKKIIIAKDTHNLKIIKKIKKKNFSNVLISPTSTLVYDFMNLKKSFMVYNIDYKQNLISAKLKNKVKFYYF